MDATLSETAKRLANHVETKTAEILPQLLAESRTSEANHIMHHVDMLVQALRATSVDRAAQ
ncbi:MAG TPA: hypothetical protein VH107_20135 [Lacipirellulaceae bacterium]|nr:hypothetical protein [Lacipirellulaceae bacterium]